MPTFLISISMLVLLLAGSCSNTPAPVPKGPWSIDYKTSGGFAGVGKGNIAVDSEGKCAFKHDLPNRTVTGVVGNLYARQLQPLNEAVARLDPKSWNKPGLNVAAPDAFGYKLELRTGPDKKDVATVQWYDNTAGELPADLKRLDVLLEDLIKHQCGGPP